MLQLLQLVKKNTFTYNMWHLTVVYVTADLADISKTALAKKNIHIKCLYRDHLEHFCQI